MFFCPGLISFILVNCSPILISFLDAPVQRGSRQGVNFNLKRKEYISGCWWIKMYKIFSFGWMLTAYHKYSLLNGRTKAKSVHLANPRSQCKGHSTLPLFFSSELGFVFDFFLQSYFKMGLPLSMYRDCRSEYSMALMFWEDYTFLSLLFLYALLLYSLQNDDFFSGTITRVTLWEHRRI